MAAKMAWSVSLRVTSQKKTYLGFVLAENAQTADVRGRELFQHRGLKILEGINEFSVGTGWQVDFNKLPSITKGRALTLLKWTGEEEQVLGDFVDELAKIDANNATHEAPTVLVVYAKEDKERKPELISWDMVANYVRDGYAIYNRKELLAL